MAERELPERVVAAAAWAVVAALTAWSAWARWDVLAASPYPVGIDGYFYAIQVRALLEDGALAYPASPLTFWLMAPVALVTDPFTATKLVAAGGGALAVVPAFLIGRRVGGVAGGLAAAVLVATSGGSFYLSFEFVKNGLGLTAALTAVWLAARALERPDPGRIAAAAAALGATVLTHKMAAVLVIVLVGPALVARLARARAWRALAGGGAALVALAVIAGAVAPERFVAARDLALVDSLVTAEPAWTLPAMAVPRRDGSIYQLTIGHQGLVVAAVVVGFGLALAIGWRRRAPRPSAASDDAIAWAALALAALISLPWLAVDQHDGLGFRLRLAAFAPGAIVLAAAVGRATAALALEWRLAVAAVIGAGLLALPGRTAEGVVRAHPAMVAAMVAIPGRLPPDAVVISVERHAGFMAAWYGRVPVRLRPDAVPPARRWRMLPLAVTGRGSPVDRALTDARGVDGVAPPIGLHPGHPNGLVLVPEATWEWILGRLPPKLAAWWRAWHTI